MKKLLLLLVSLYSAALVGVGKFKKDCPQTCYRSSASDCDLAYRSCKKSKADQKQWGLESDEDCCATASVPVGAAPRFWHKKTTL